MMRLRDIFKPVDNGTPSIYADLLIETVEGIRRIDPDTEGWLYIARPLFEQALRIGLVLKWERRPRVWVHVGDDKPAYMSRVIGRMAMDGSYHERVRVACIQAGDDRIAWLHRDGTVEVSHEPKV